MNDQELGEARQRARMRNLENVPGTNERNSSYVKPSTPSYTAPNYKSSNSSSNNNTQQTRASRNGGRTTTKSVSNARNNTNSARTIITIACVLAAAYYATIWQEEEQNLIITGIAAAVAGFIGYKLYRVIGVVLFCIAGYYIYQWLEA